jgi:hypothetical protein
MRTSIRLTGIQRILPLLACLVAGAAGAAVPTTAPKPASKTEPPATAMVPAVTRSVNTTPGAAKVAYLAGAMVYADVGSLDGLRAGDSLQVFRAGARVATLKVAFVSTRRAAFDTLWTSKRIVVGDELRFTPHVAPVPVAAVTPAPARPTGLAAMIARQRSPRIRGRVGGRYLAVSTGGMGFQQPALDLRFDGYNQLGGHVDVSVDVRNRRTVRTGTSSSSPEQISRVYRGSVVVRTVDSHRSFSVGRQTSASLASVSLFDGALVQSGNDRHSFGFFGGTQPDPASFGLSHDVFESGGFVEFHSAAASERRYQLSLGGITSRDSGQTNRDFLFTQGSWSTRRLMSSFTQELDLNRGWKRKQGEAVLTPTSTFWMMRVVPLKWLGIGTGFDNRRNVRLYRDHTTPADQFDDSYRQGAWVGGDVEFLKRFRVSGETRGSSGADHSSSWSGSAEAYRISALHISLRGRMSEFTGSSVTSRLWSSSLGMDPTPLSHVEAAGGVRGTRMAPATAWSNQNWQSIDVDLTLGRRWYMNGGYERDYGGSGGTSEQVQGGISWRF